MTKLSVTARVSVTIEVHILRPWDASVSAETVFKQAAEEATSALQRRLGDDGTLRIVGSPHVRVVTAEKEE